MKATFNKYTNEDLKILAHEMFNQGEFESFDKAYETICFDRSEHGLSDGWLDFFFEQVNSGKPVAVFRNPDSRNYNVMGCTRDEALELAMKMNKPAKKKRKKLW